MRITSRFLVPRRDLQAKCALCGGLWQGVVLGERAASTVPAHSVPNHSRGGRA